MKCASVVLKTVVGDYIFLAAIVVDTLMNNKFRSI